jgi:alpha-glucosidase
VKAGCPSAGDDSQGKGDTHAMTHRKSSLVSGARGPLRPLALAAGLLAALWAAGGGRAADDTLATSPDKSVQFKVTAQEGRLRYSVSFKDRAVIETSPLGFSVDTVDVTEGVQVGEVTAFQVKETYPWRGVHSQAVHHGGGKTIRLTHARSNTRYVLEVRAYNDAVAFRFIVPGEKESRVPDETTRFTLPAGSTVWYHDLNGHYEGVHAKKAIADVKEGEWAAPPLTFKLPGGAGSANAASSWSWGTSTRSRIRSSCGTRHRTSTACPNRPPSPGPSLPRGGW